MDVDFNWLRESFQEKCHVLSDEHLKIVYLALKMNKPLLLCGPSGTGKTEMAKTLSFILHAKLIRLQCYEGLDESKALYDWNYQKQIIELQLANRDNFFSWANLLQRPLLQAITAFEPTILLIERIDEADRHFESFLLEVLSEFQITIPEIGTIKAKQIPIVIITGSGKRELTEALKRRCLFLYLDFPEPEAELKIIRKHLQEILPQLHEAIAEGIADIQTCRDPERLDWIRTLLAFDSGCYNDEYMKRLNALLEKKFSCLEI